MKAEELFNKIKEELDLKLNFLADKPEENSDSTVRACWHTAYGFPKSAEEATKLPLPELTEKQIDVLYGLIAKRLNNIPLAYISGRQSFMGIELLADKRSLIPRKETEILGRKALQISISFAREKKCVNVMDICAGSGNLGLAVAYYNHNTVVYATDLSHEAVEHARDNVSFLNLTGRVHVEQGDLFSAFDNKNHYENTDIVICNPPYISSAKVAKMNTEILAHEPEMAFDGGIFGIKILQKLIVEAPKYLASKGWVVFEVGLGQGKFMVDLCERTNNYSQIETANDANNSIRVVAAQKKS